MEVYSDSNRCLTATSLKESSATPFWGEDLELYSSFSFLVTFFAFNLRFSDKFICRTLKPHERTLVFKFFGVETKKSRKEIKPGKAKIAPGVSPHAPKGARLSPSSLNPYT